MSRGQVGAMCWLGKGREALPKLAAPFRPCQGPEYAIHYGRVLPLQILSSWSPVTACQTSSWLANFSHGILSENWKICSLATWLLVTGNFPDFERVMAWQPGDPKCTSGPCRVPSGPVGALIPHMTCPLRACFLTSLALAISECFTG